MGFLYLQSGFEKVQNGNIFWGHKISNIYLGMPDIPDIFIG